MVDFQSRDTSRGFGSDEDEQSDDKESEQTDDEQTTEEVSEQQAQETAHQDNSDTPGQSGDQGVDAAPEPVTQTAEPAGQVSSFAVVTVTDERSISEDDQGEAVVDAIEDAGDQVTTRNLIRSSYDTVQSSVSTLAERSDTDVVVTVGGTGVEPDDVTVEAIEALFEKQLPGFGELFRLLAHEREGTAVVGTRATAGLVDQTPVFALPGTVSGVRLGMEEIVLAEGPLLAAEASPTHHS